MQTIRIDKFITSNSSYSRSQIKILIKKQGIKVNGEIINGIVSVNPDIDTVTVFGETIHNHDELIYIALNKPKNYVCANIDLVDKTIFDILKKEYLAFRKLHSVGRLDKDTEGLLIITNDGKFTHNITSPRKKVNKTYFVKVNKTLDLDLVNHFKKGINIGEKKLTKSSQLKILDHYTCHLTILEGKYHQVKRMFKAFGYDVLYLQRIAIGGLFLDDLNINVGESIVLTKEQLAQIAK
ncbi:pseudouridine synthase [Mycoplasma sp. NEAQ87857]|uniref:pseudouridine synthase n=1 Tax=Mycoplasma sp. NEAQ87857 TaxID=2683967 RepID=UPI001318812F|nr:pseudouridine synthase [Mycoplasma sp. NEAQ87857]QGZ97742.1 pseudouridine synthase [Mycoplasma sp. NEAQ87857]